ncbi:NUDIX hydrolase [Sphingobacterium psychroaquaticum]|uniref:8-oxo-dGTP diphosphatase n=1 Tax=Sphingobacterium psychroaquaticum TaxID=561061 RepID=A0A1X7JMZ3_9SPHI|nr:NUDIX domain-containing protein [Sphingobacterium psychroaquaticum]QBQ40885.1 NUDIX domain-containing protein [Sphingobacterium psychroaquaticum]SMG29606.1 8-oxo-dGTP diphosphatase [Sphingobacterium psychroaquaticum]
MQTHFTIDCVVYSFFEGDLQVLLTERNEYPYKDWWALPGFFVGNLEEMEDAVKRISYELTGLKDVFMEQLGAFAGVKRHPQGRILTVAYSTIVRYDDVKSQIKPVTDYMRQAKWFPVKELPELAFDHKEIIDKSLQKLKSTVNYSTAVYELLPEKFTLTQLQQVYESILNKELDKRNFRKKIANLGFLKELPEVQKGVSYRAARLYKFDKRKFQKSFGVE